MGEKNNSRGRSTGGLPDLQLGTTFDPDDAAVSEALIRTIASIEDADSTTLEPLAAWIDPEALDLLVSARSETETRDGYVRVSFRYAGYVVDVESDGTIWFYLDDDRE